MWWNDVKTKKKFEKNGIKGIEDEKFRWKTGRKWKTTAKIVKKMMGKTGKYRKKWEEPKTRNKGRVEFNYWLFECDDNGKWSKNANTFQKKVFCIGKWENAARNWSIERVRINILLDLRANCNFNALKCLIANRMSACSKHCAPHAQKRRRIIRVKAHSTIEMRFDSKLSIHSVGIGHSMKRSGGCE